MNISKIKTRSHVFLLFFLLTLDQWLKEWSRNLDTTTFNHGIILGNYLPLDSLNLTLAFVTFSILCLFLYFLLLIQLPRTVAASRLGLTFLVAGIAGNGIDRLFWNRTTDYIHILNLSFNFADLCFVAGIMLFSFLYLKSRISDRKRDHRQNILILAADQVRLSFTLSMLVFAAGMILGVFAAMFLNIHFVDYASNGTYLLKKYIYLHIAVTFTISLMFFVFCLFYTHHLAGPVFGFLRYLKRNEGKMIGEFKSRDRDFFHVFEEADLELAASKKS